MAEGSHLSDGPRRVTRREFIIQLAALASLLAACDRLERPATPTTAPSPTSAPIAPPPTVAPTAGPTATPTLRPVPPRPAIIQFHPDAPSQMVHARHAGLWSGDELVPGALHQMLDAAITRLTGLDDAPAASAALFRPEERIAIKVNTIAGSSAFTHVPLVTAVTECLQGAGVPADQIVIFDRYDYELGKASFTINQDEPGVRCYGTDNHPGWYVRNWKVLDSPVELTSILLDHDALINIPVLKQHMYGGISFAMKNHFGIFDRSDSYHQQRTGPAITELNALAPVRDRQRLVVGDALAVVLGDCWDTAVPGDSILMSFDPVAHDAVALSLWSAVWQAKGGDPNGYQQKALIWLTKSADLDLGANDLKISSWRKSSWDDKLTGRDPDL